MRQQVIKDVGGKVWCDFPARPASVLVTCKRASGQDLADTAINAQAATIDPMVATYSAGTVPEESKAVPVSLATGATPVNGMRLEMNTPHSVREINTLSYWYFIAPNADPRTAVLVLRNPFRIPPEASTTFSACRAYVSLSAAQCARIEANNRAVFTATIEGESVVKEVIFDVGLRTHDNPATAADLLDKWSDYRYSETIEWQLEQGAPAISTGWKDVCLKVRAYGRNPNRIRDTDPLIPLIVNRAVKSLGLYGVLPNAWANSPKDFLERIDADFEQLFSDAMASVEWYDDQDFGSTGYDRKVQNSITLIRG